MRTTDRTHQNPIDGVLSAPPIPAHPPFGVNRAGIGAAIGGACELVGALDDVDARGAWRYHMPVVDRSLEIQV